MVPITAHRVEPERADSGPQMTAAFTSAPTAVRVEVPQDGGSALGERQGEGER